MPVTTDNPGFPPGSVSGLAGSALALGFLAAHALMLLGARRPAAGRARLLAVDLGLAALFGLLLLSGRLGTHSAGLDILRHWLPLLFFWWAYGWMGPLLGIFRGPEDGFDRFLLRLDGRLFGQPSLWLARGKSRWLTELFHLAYASYYLYTPFLGGFLYLANRQPEFEVFAIAVMFGYAICYLAYPLVPVLGPRWSLVEEGLLERSEQRLAGYQLTEAMNRIMYGGLALKGGAMPSAHSSTAVIFLVWCFRLWGEAGGVPAAGLVLAMMAGSIYGRYHYVTDILAGAAVGLLALWVAEGLAPTG